MTSSGRLTSLLFLVISLTAVTADAQLNKTRGNGPSDSPESTFVVHRLSHDHSEGITVIDVNRDGKADLLSGAYWYENPGTEAVEWKRHQFRTVDIVGEFVSDCGEWAIDVNHDGAPDLVTVGWMTDGLWWYENPKKPDVMWQKHFITHTLETEGGWLADINNDGKPDLALAHYGRSGVIWVDFATPSPTVHKAGGHDEDGHGIGVADIDGDGKMDILTPHGWFKNVDATADKLEWHADWDLGETGFPIVGYDVNGDGKIDLIYGRGHSFGLYWLEQKQDGSSRSWVKHTIDESFSQVHVLRMIDIDGDGQPELLAGKRYRGHNGNDPGSYDPLALYYYRLDPKTATFSRVPIAINGTMGAGTQFVVEDFDNDGDLDLATAGKTGLHVAENLKIDHVSKESREKQLLLDMDWPPPGEGVQSEWQHGAKK